MRKIAGSPTMLKKKKKTDKIIQNLLSNRIVQHYMSRVDNIGKCDDEQYLIDNVENFRLTSFRVVYERVHVWVDYTKEVVWIVTDHSMNGMYYGPTPAPPHNAVDVKVASFEKFKEEYNTGHPNPVACIGNRINKPLLFLDKLFSTKIVNANGEITKLLGKTKVISEAIPTQKSGFWKNVWDSLKTRDKL